MKVDRNSQIGGQPLKLVRDCLRQRHNGYINVEIVLKHLQQNWWHGVVEDLFVRGLISRDARNYARNSFDPSDRQIYGVRVPKVPDFSKPAQTLFDYLLAEGYIKPDDAPPYKGKVWHRTTIKGQALSMTKLVSRINRAKAEALLKGALERVAAINADPDMMHWVTEVRVFGSYLTGSDDLGDLDLALNYERRPTEGDFIDAVEAFAAKHDREYLPWEDKLRLSEKMVRQRIKGRSPYISMHGIDELERNPEMFGGKVVYTFTPSGGMPSPIST